MDDILEFIKGFEGFEGTAYRCPGGKLTIGYGHTQWVYEGMVINEIDAGAILYHDVLNMAVAVMKLIPDKEEKISKNKKDAILSLVYNIGIQKFAKSTLLRKLEADDFEGAADEFLRWNKAGNTVLRGLVRRRKAERELFLKEG